MSLQKHVLFFVVHSAAWEDAYLRLGKRSPVTRKNQTTNSALLAFQATTSAKTQRPRLPPNRTAARPSSTTARLSPSLPRPRARVRASPRPLHGEETAVGLGDEMRWGGRAHVHMHGRMQARTPRSHSRKRQVTRWPLLRDTRQDARRTFLFLFLVLPVFTNDAACWRVAGAGAGCADAARLSPPPPPSRAVLLVLPIRRWTSSTA